MSFEHATLSRAALEDAVARARRRPHGDIHKGNIIFPPEVFAETDRETNVCISPFAVIDCTADIHIGPWTLIGARSRVYTHEHILIGGGPLLKTQEEYGLLYQDKYIGADVWINDGAVVLCQVTEIPDGVFLGAGAVLTKNPGPYEIWAGTPARKIGERDRQATDGDIRALLARGRFSLRHVMDDVPPPFRVTKKRRATG